MRDEHGLLAIATSVVTLEGVLLDDRRWDEWLALYSPDCEFWMPTWIDEERLADDPLTQLSQIYYTSRKGLEDRVARIATGRTAASNPLRRTTHQHSNFLLLDAGAGDTLSLRCAWTTHVYDPNSKESLVLFGNSRYTLRGEDGRWIIARKKVVVQNDRLPSMLDVNFI